MVTERIGVRVSTQLVDAARKAIGKPDAPVSDVLRVALANLAGVDVEHFTPKRTGRPRTKAA